jgi:DNA primase
VTLQGKGKGGGELSKMYPSLNYCKGKAENTAIETEQEIPEGYTIAWNETTRQVSLFIDSSAYKEKARPEDKIVTRWVNGKWEDSGEG